MDDIITDVNEGWNDENPKRSIQYVLSALIPGLVLSTQHKGLKVVMTT